MGKSEENSQVENTSYLIEYKNSVDTKILVKFITISIFCMCSAYFHHIKASCTMMLLLFKN